MPRRKKSKEDEIPNQKAARHVHKPRIEDALNYIKEVKERFSSDPNMYIQFLDILKDFKFQVIDTRGVVRRINKMFKERRELVSGFNTFLPQGYQIGEISSSEEEDEGRKDPPHDFDKAFLYITSVKRRFGKQPEVYRKFLEILHSYEDQKTPLKDIYENIEKLFSNEADLLKGFTEFLPKRHLKKRRFRRRRKRGGDSISDSDGLGEDEIDESLLKVTPNRFFELLRSRLDSQSYFEFIQFSRMFLGGKMNKFEFLKACKNIIPEEGPNGKLFRMFQTLLSNENGSGTKFRLPDEPDDPERNRFGPSYSLYRPKDRRRETFQGQNLMDKRIQNTLNNVYESSNVFDTSEHPFKSETEQMVFEMENQRCEFEVYMDLNKSVREHLEFLNNKLKEKNEEIERRIEEEKIKKRDEELLKEKNQQGKRRGKKRNYKDLADIDEEDILINEQQSISPENNFEIQKKLIISNIFRKIHESYLLQAFGRDEGKKVIEVLYQNPFEVIPKIIEHLVNVYNHQIKVQGMLNKETEQVNGAYMDLKFEEEKEEFLELEKNNLDVDFITNNFNSWFGVHHQHVTYIRNKQTQSDLFFILTKTKLFTREESEKVKELWKNLIVPFMDLNNFSTGNKKKKKKKKIEDQEKQQLEEQEEEEKEEEEEETLEFEKNSKFFEVLHSQEPFSPLKDYSNKLYASTDFLIFFYFYNLVYSRLLQIRTHLTKKSNGPLSIKFPIYFKALLSHIKGELDLEEYNVMSKKLFGTDSTYIITINLKVVIQEFSRHIRSMLEKKPHVTDTFIKAFEFHHQARETQQLLIHQKTRDEYYDRVNQYVCIHAPELRLFLFKYNPYLRRITVTKVYDDYVPFKKQKENFLGVEYLRNTLLQHAQIPAPPPPPTPEKERKKRNQPQLFGRDKFIHRRKRLRKHIFPIRIYLPRNKERTRVSPLGPSKIEVVNGMVHRVRMEDLKLVFKKGTYDVMLRVWYSEQNKQKQFYHQIGEVGVNKRKKRFQKAMDNKRTELSNLIRESFKPSLFEQLQQERNQRSQHPPPPAQQLMKLMMEKQQQQQQQQSKILPPPPPQQQIIPPPPTSIVNTQAIQVIPTKLRKSNLSTTSRKSKKKVSTGTSTTSEAETMKSPPPKPSVSTGTSTVIIPPPPLPKKKLEEKKV